MGINHTPIGMEYGWLSPCKLSNMKVGLCGDVHSSPYKFH
jgi:hypothetical protein